MIRIKSGVAILMLALALTLELPAIAGATPSWIASTTLLADSQYGLGHSDDLSVMAVPSWAAWNHSLNGGDTFGSLTIPGTANYSTAWVSPDGQTVWLNSSIVTAMAVYTNILAARTATWNDAIRFQTSCVGIQRKS